LLPFQLFSPRPNGGTWSVVNYEQIKTQAMSPDGGSGLLNDDESGLPPLAKVKYRLCG
jgi:hypothetical protein